MGLEGLGLACSFVGFYSSFQDLRLKHPVILACMASIGYQQLCKATLSYMLIAEHMPSQTDGLMQKEPLLVLSQCLMPE